MKKPVIYLLFWSNGRDYGERDDDFLCASHDKCVLGARALSLAIWIKKKKARCPERPMTDLPDAEYDAMSEKRDAFIAKLKPPYPQMARAVEYNEDHTFTVVERPLL